MREKIVQPLWFRFFLLLLPLLLGSGLVVYEFLVHRIASRHGVTNYMMLCTGFICISIGCVGIALEGTDDG
jgi:hypothetical protein